MCTAGCMEQMLAHSLNLLSCYFNYCSNSFVGKSNRGFEQQEGFSSDHGAVYKNFNDFAKQNSLCITAAILCCWPQKR